MDSINRFLWKEKITEVKDVTEIIQDYQNIIKEFENYSYNNYINNRKQFQDIITKLKQNKQNISLKFQSKDKEINEYKETLEKIKSEKALINKLQLTNQKNEEKIDKYKNTISKLKKEKSDMENIRNDYKIKEKELEESKKNLEELSNDLKTKENNIENLKGQIAANEEEINSLKSNLQIKDNGIESLKNNLKQLKNDYDLKEKIIEELNENIKVNQNNIILLNNNIQSKEKNIVELKDNIKLKNTELEKIKNILKEKENQIELLTTNIKLYEKKIYTLQNINQSKEKQIEKISNNLKICQNEVDSLKNNLKLSEEKFIELEKKYQLKEKSIEELNNNLKLKAQELKKFSDNLKSKENEINILNENIKENEKKLNELSIDLKSKLNEIDSLNNHLKKKLSEINELKTDKSKLTKNLKDNENNLRNLQNEINEKNKQLEELIKHIGELTSDNKKYKAIEKDLKQSEEEKIKLEKEKEKLLSNTSIDILFKDKDLKDFYDVVIEIDSINTLTKTGWKINYNEKRKEIYDDIIQKETLKIGVLGLNNVGKSFILGLLSKYRVPTGYSIETKGISIKYTKGEENCDTNICLLDSAGIETPLLIDEIKDKEEPINENAQKNEVDKNLSIMDKLEEISKDKSQTERFIEELIISLSDMLILVVGKLTRREQNFISRIKKIVQEKENNQFKSIIIIHNLAHYNEIEEVERHINEVLKKSATSNLLEKQVIGIEKYEGRVFYTEEDGTNHLIMARDGSKAGNKYNDLTIELIKRKFNDCQNRKKIDIPQEIIELFSKMSKDIVEDIVEIKNLHISEDKKVITVSEINKHNNKKNNEFKLQKSYVDEMGKYNSISNKYTPKCSYYAYKDHKKKYCLLIRVEIPGKIENLTAHYFKYGKKNTIEIKGIKSKDDFPEMKAKHFYQIGDNRNYEEIRYLLELQNEIELYKQNPIEKTQTYEFEFNTNNIDHSKDNKEIEESESDSEEKEKEVANEKKEVNKIASGVYVLKFELTETSWQNISKKYKKIQQ